MDSSRGYSEKNFPGLLGKFFGYFAGGSVEIVLFPKGLEDQTSFDFFLIFLCFFHIKTLESYVKRSDCAGFFVILPADTF